METAITIWIIGWMAASGVHFHACEMTGDESRASKWGALIPFIVIWPHYLGYCAATRGKL